MGRGGGSLLYEEASSSGGTQAQVRRRYSGLCQRVNMPSGSGARDRGVVPLCASSSESCLPRNCPADGTQGGRARRPDKQESGGHRPRCAHHADCLRPRWYHFRNRKRKKQTNKQTKKNFGFGGFNGVHSCNPPFTLGEINNGAIISR